MVHATVRLMALNVFVGVLDGGDAEDDDDGQENEAGGDGGELWEELEDGNEEKEAVEGERREDRGEIGKTNMLAMRRNCSRRLRGRKVRMVYFEEMTWLVGGTWSLMGLRLWSKKWSGRGWLTNTVRGVVEERFRVNKDSTLKTGRAQAREEAKGAMVATEGQGASALD